MNKIKTEIEKYIELNKENNIKHSIITILGHVNHGKTSILNRIISKKYNEYGNITQYIKKFYIKINNSILTFIDTPGHESFVSMRNLSVKITDIILLIISVDDGIQNQTIECINYILKFKIKFFIVINKIDKKIFNKNKILNELVNNYNIVPEEWGGNNKILFVSAKYDTGIDNLINNILSISNNIFNFKKSIIENKISSAIIIESYIDKKIGIVISVIIKKGIFKIGNYITTSLEKNKKIKAIYSMKEKLNFAIPSMPIEIIGLSKLPNLGEEIFSYLSKKDIDNINLEKNISLNNTKKDKIIINNNFKEKINDDLNIILKTDVKGTENVILNILKNIKNKYFKINILYSDIGDLNINDLKKSILFKSILIGFNIKINNNINKIINNNKNILFKNYFVIYDLIYDINNIIEEKIKLIEKKTINNKILLGEGIIKNIYNLPIGVIAGCFIDFGIINVKNSINILRNNNIIYTGKIKSIKIYNKNVIEVKKNDNCGIILYNFNNFKIKDIIKVFNNSDNNEKR